MIVAYRYREYATVINLISLSGRVFIIEYLIDLVIKKISLSRLILGGAAMLAQQNINHHIDRAGMITKSPLVRVTLRVFVIAYVMFAIQNSAEELSPWASIIVSLACIPSFDPVIIAATISPI